MVFCSFDPIYIDDLRFKIFMIQGIFFSPLNMFTKFSLWKPLSARCVCYVTFTGSWGSKFMPNTEEFVGNLWKVTLATLELLLQFKTAQYFILWSRSLSCHCCCILDQLLPLYSENSRKIFLRSCNCECTQPERPCTLKNPSRRGWQISWGRLLLNNLLA